MRPTNSNLKTFLSFLDKDPQLKKETKLLVKLNERYRKTRDSFGTIPRSFWRSHGGTERFTNYGLSWEDFKELGLLTGESARFDRRKVEAPIRVAEPSKIFFLSSAIAGQTAFIKGIESVQNAWAKDRGGQLIILAMRGAYEWQTYDARLADLASIMGTEYDFNENLRAVDFNQYPRNEDPLSRLEMFGETSKSLIAAHAKQFFRCKQVPQGAAPATLWSTGAITLAGGYGKVERGALAYQRHVLGGLIIEVKDRKTFFIRQAQFDKNGGFFDLNKYYCGDKVVEHRAKIMKLPDLHAGWTDFNARKAVWDQIKYFNPEVVRVGDAFDASSISHHQFDKFASRLQMPRQFSSLRAELEAYADELELWATEFPNLRKIIDFSNHDEHLFNVLNKRPSGWPYWINDLDRLTLYEMLPQFVDGKNPLEWWIKTHRPAAAVGWEWANSSDSHIVGGTEWARHGHVAGGGLRKPGWKGLERSFKSAVIGHVHSPYLQRQMRAAGTMAFKQPYASDVPTNWLCSSVVGMGNEHTMHLNAIPVKGGAMEWKL